MKPSDLLIFLFVLAAITVLCGVVAVRKAHWDPETDPEKGND